MRSLALIFTISLFACDGLAIVQIPTGLTRADRQEAVRILGFATSGKLLSDPFPLGGYQGLELAVGVESLPVQDLGRLGSTLASPQQDITYPKFSIGKGLYNNIDIFMHFIPYTQNTDLSLYGGILRWGFFQAGFLPLSLSVLAHFNNANINNQVATRSMGLDLVGGINADDVALYIAGGPVQSRGRFIGGATGVTDSGQLESVTVAGFHTAIGANIDISNLFLALQIDRYTTTVYSAKLGLRL